MKTTSSDETGRDEGATAAATEPADCRNCDLRTRCIAYGWRSPGGVWFENAVVLTPKPGCRGFVGRGGDIRSHFRKTEPVPH